jgi:hypothetical protein
MIYVLMNRRDEKGGGRGPCSEGAGTAEPGQQILSDPGLDPGELRNLRRVPLWAPIRNSSFFRRPKCGTREARPKDSRRIPPTNSEFLARLRALIFRQEAGSKSEAILT